MRTLVVSLTLVVALAFSSHAWAVDDPDALLPGWFLDIVPGRLVKITAGVPARDFAAPTVPISTGSLRVFDTAPGGAGDNTYALAGTWRSIGNPPYRWIYRGSGSPADPCKVVRIRTRDGVAAVKAACLGSAVQLQTPFLGDVGVVLAVGVSGSGKRYCARFGGQTVANDDRRTRRERAPAPVACPSPATTTTTLPSCCGAERLTFTSTAGGTLQVDNLPPFPFPAGITTVLDTTPAMAGPPACEHDVHVPTFSVPSFGIPALNYCSQIVALGCESGTGVGKGKLWDGNGSTAAAEDVSKQADTSDGVCDTSYTGANCTSAGVGANTLGRIQTTRTAGATAGLRSAIDVPVRSLTWSDSACSPFAIPGCCTGSTYEPADGDLLITTFDFILSPTTGVATGAFVDLNADTCKRAGAGFDSAAPGQDGPKSLSGTAPPGPCCTVGQAFTDVAVGVGFSGGGPLYDLGFKSIFPSTVSACGAPVGGSCVLTSNTCLGSPSGAFVR